MNAPRKTGWPEPALAQDDHRGLFRWFASKPDARVRVREALPSCCQYHGFEENGCNGRNCPEGRIDLRALATRREPFDWQLLVIWIAVAVAFGAVAAMSFGPQIAELIDTLWPRLVFAASF